MMKRYITLSLLGLVMAISSWAQETFTEGDFSYLPTGSATVSVAGCTLGEGALAIIPETVIHEGKTYSVTGIGAGAFSSTLVSAIWMPATVTSIGDGAFANCAATFIKVTPNVKTIGVAAFAGCSALGHIDLPTTLERVESGLCNSSPIYTIGTTTLPKLTYVGDGAMSGTHLRSFPLTDNVTEIGAGAFYKSRLQSIYLPAGLTELSDNVLQGCSDITAVTLPAGITRIGKLALAGTSISSIDLSKYQGSIDILAFNECRQLDRLTLPASNPYCYTSEDGKALYSRERQDLLCVLPTVERLTVPYPATGVYDNVTTELVYEDPETGEQFFETYHDYSYFLNGEFPNLKQLELPHSWNASLENCTFQQLGEVTLRVPAEQFTNKVVTLPLATAQSTYEKTGKPINIEVFSYAKDAFLGTNAYWSNWVRDGLATITEINRPTEELYMAEVRPMYDQQALVEEGKTLIYTGDWNAAIEEAYPQYFTANDVATSRDELKTPFRNYLFSQYLTADRFHAYDRPDDTVLKCIDGEIHLATGFEPNNYTNWFLQTQFVPGTDYLPVSSLPIVTDTYTQSTTLPANPSWGLPVDDYAVFSRETGEPTAYFALHMVPDVAYNIYAVVPPRHPYSMDATEESEGIEYKNRVRGYLTYVSGFNEETGLATTKSVNSGNKDFLYESGKVDSLLLLENVQVASDVYNVFYVQSQRLPTTLRRDGYTPTIPLIGVLCVPQTEFEIYPDAVQGIKPEATTVVARYDISGRRLTSPQRGVNILRMSDGTTRKVMVK